MSLSPTPCNFEEVVTSTKPFRSPAAIQARIPLLERNYTPKSQVCQTTLFNGTSGPSRTLPLIAALSFPSCPWLVRMLTPQLGSVWISPGQIAASHIAQGVPHVHNEQLQDLALVKACHDVAKALTFPTVLPRPEGLGMECHAQIGATRENFSHVSSFMIDQNDWGDFHIHCTQHREKATRSHETLLFCCARHASWLLSVLTLQTGVKMMVFKKDRLFRLGIHTLIAVLLLGGCASKYGAQITTVEFYQKCYQPIQDLRDAEKAFNNTVAGTIIAGAVLGGIAGALTGRPHAALIGIGVGLAAGTVAGYALAKQMEFQDDNKRLASYIKDLDGDISGLDRVTAAAQTARICYDEQFYIALDAFKAGKMSREDFNRRYTEIKNGSMEAGQILGVIIDSASSRDLAFQDALKKESEKAKRAVPKPVASVVAAHTSTRQQHEPTASAKSPQDKKSGVSNSSAPGKTALQQKVAQAMAPKTNTKAKPSVPKVRQAETKQTEPSAKPVQGEKPKTAEQPAASRNIAKSEKPAAPKPKQAATESPKVRIAETGDQLTDMSTRQAIYSHKVTNAKDQKALLDEVQADREKLVAQLTG